jgi:transcriptional repressor NrdR
MRCPFCNADKESLKVIDSRTCEGGRAIRRRRECNDCTKRFTTYERIEQPIRLMVVKKDGRRVPWDKAKILAGLERACFKRPVPESELLRIADEVEEEAFNAHDREVQTGVIGQLVTDRLRRLDQVAYVRFASVYRQFKTLEELVDEARAVIDARRYEDPPGQGRLFVDPNRAVNGAATDEPAGSRPAAGAGEKPGSKRSNGRRGGPNAAPASASASAGTPGGESE